MVGARPMVVSTCLRHGRRSLRQLKPSSRGGLNSTTIASGAGLAGWHEPAGAAPGPRAAFERGQYVRAIEYQSRPAAL